MRKILFGFLLICSVASCKKDDDNNDPSDTVNPGADWSMEVINSATTTITVNDLPAPDTNASVTNYPQVLMQRPAAARFQAPAGFVVNLFEERMPDARNLCVAPNGDVFVAQQNMNRIAILRDADNDGHADTVFTWAEGGILARPYGMAFYQNKFYVATSGALFRYDYSSGQTSGGMATKLAEYPAGGQHPARGLAIDTVNNKIYIGIGSSVNVGIEDDARYASIQQYNLDGSGNVPYAQGTRNPQGLAINYAGSSPAVWSVVNERDGIGDELVPDYATRIVAGGFYGWPFVYLRADKPDPRIKASDPRVAATITPDVLIKSHAAALGIMFYTGTQFPEEFRGDAYVACRGSWNRANASGYKILRVRVNAQGRAEGGYEEFLRGWRVNEGQPGVPEVFGRPLNMTMAKDGSLLIADDAGGAVWRLRYKG